MKYILEFNPYKDNLSKRNILDLKDFCNGYLAYLLDDDYILKVSQISTISPNNMGITQVILTKRDYREYFTWNDVKDYMIPLFVGVSKNYKIKDLSLLKKTNKVDILIDDTIINDAIINYIDMRIKDDDSIECIKINITTLK